MGTLSEICENDFFAGIFCCGMWNGILEGNDF